ncbi:hypothetical protein GRS80_03205 [Natrialba sp. INN-245]|nr:hypothetical protein [Natrialba sp. INN-245]
MLNSNELDKSQTKSIEQRRAFIKQWAEYVRTHDDAEWSRQQNKLINSQIRSAKESAKQGDTDPVRFQEAIDRLQKR